MEPLGLRPDGEKIHIRPFVHQSFVYLVIAVVIDILVVVCNFKSSISDLDTNRCRSLISDRRASLMLYVLRVSEEHSGGKEYTSADITSDRLSAYTRMPSLICPMANAF